MILTEKALIKRFSPNADGVSALVQQTLLISVPKAFPEQNTKPA